ncbi:DUF2946 family protein [Massilia atriviolacea]|uniref:DUF2946 family protein n=1 Tax=Massilia atriviolacea TaxID=2495579 RepID=A0A430HH43_9BURK|nr:DUF2946 family protein [Massilia atriviolacea]RSZ56826.1 DUF2946 family protein [Massilia atriviolacea]
MDDIVKKAMAKWPDVPHCYGWLALDARGNWRMRDERAQHLDLAGDKVVQLALLGFINRNYLSDERGCWFFQNGPQRVFVNLEATPFIARTDPAHGLVLHTGEPVAAIARAWMTENGELIVDSAGKIAQVDDRDVAQLMAALEIDGQRASDEALMAWLDGAAGQLTLRYQGRAAPVERIARAELAAQLRFVRMPAPSGADGGTDPVRAA